MKIMLNRASRRNQSW